MKRLTLPLALLLVASAGCGGQKAGTSAQQTTTANQDARVDETKDEEAAEDKETADDKDTDDTGAKEEGTAQEAPAPATKAATDKAPAPAPTLIKERSTAKPELGRSKTGIGIGPGKPGTMTRPSGTTEKTTEPSSTGTMTRPGSK